MIGTFHECSMWLHEHGKDGKRYEVKELREKRTLTQNAYYWALENRLAAILRISNEELHFQLLQRYAPVTGVILRADVDWPAYYKYTVLEWEDEKKNAKYWRVYKGSSEMDTAEFTRLLDGLVSECKEVGIETATPEELALMREESERERGETN